MEIEVKRTEKGFSVNVIENDEVVLSEELDSEKGEYLKDCFKLDLKRFFPEYEV